MNPQFRTLSCSFELGKINGVPYRKSPSSERTCDLLKKVCLWWSACSPSHAGTPELVIRKWSSSPGTMARMRASVRPNKNTYS